MNLPPELAAWLRPMGLIAVEVAGLVAAATLAQRLVRSPAGRRTLWQGCLLSILVLLAVELSGAGRHLSALLVAQSKPQIPPRSETSATPVIPTADRQPPIANAVGTSESLSHQTLNAQTVAPAPSSPGSLQLREGFRRQVAGRVAANRENGARPLAPSAAGNSETRAALPPLPSDLTNFPEPTWIGLGWILGAGLLALRVLLARSLTAWFRLRSQPVTDSRLVATAQSLARRLGLSPSLSLKESARLRGPIAFGLWRPTIVLPRGFGRQFSAAQQEAMLAHEIAHLAARDPLWHLLADLAAALLWWHPLVWWARRQSQAASETAADAASVLVADGPQVLAECLVELGNRLTQREALGWLGVSGFRSQLGRRVEHLLSLKHGAWRPPGRWRQALVKALGALAVVALTLFGTAWALPQTLTQGDNMRTIRQSWKQSLAAFTLLASVGSEGLTASTAEPVAPAPAAAPAAQNTPQPDPRFMERYGVKPTPAHAPAVAGEPASSEFQRQMQKRYGLRPGAAAAMSASAEAPPAQNAPQMDPKLMERYGIRPTPPPAGPSSGVSGGGFGGGFGGGGGVLGHAPGSALEGKLEKILFDEVAFDGIPLPKVLKFLNEESRKRDAEKKGINFLINPNSPQPSAPSPFVDPTTGQLIPAPSPEPIDMNNVLIMFSLPLRDVRLKDVLDAVVKVADRPILYSVEDYAVVFSPKSAMEELETRIFKVNPNAFAEGLRAVGLTAAGSITPGNTSSAGQPSATTPDPPRIAQDAVRAFFRAAGFDINPPNQLFFNDRTGVLMVRASSSELDRFQKAIEVLNVAPSQLTLEATLVEITQGDVKALGFDWFMGNGVGGTGTPMPVAADAGAGVWPGQAGGQGTSVPAATDPGAGVWLGQVGGQGTPKPAVATNLTGILTEPQARLVLKALEQRDGVNVLAMPRVTTLSGRQMQLQIDGVLTLDVLPYVTADGYSIQMTVMASLDTADRSATTTKLSRISTSAVVWDGQTVVLGGLQKTAPSASGDAPSEGRKNVMLMITPTIIDPAGNRVHTADNLPYDPSFVPPQIPPKSASSNVLK